MWNSYNRAWHVVYAHLKLATNFYFEFLCLIHYWFLNQWNLLIILLFWLHPSTKENCESCFTNPEL